MPELVSQKHLINIAENVTETTTITDDFGYRRI